MTTKSAKRVVRCIAIILPFAALMPELADTETLTSAEIISRSASKQCLDWKLIGVCFWLVCRKGRCRIRTTSKIQHNLPDLVVSTFPHQTPWLEMRAAHPDVRLGAGGGDQSRENTHSMTVRFKEAQVVGNPAVTLRNIFDVPFICRSKAKPSAMYFNSQHPLNNLQWRGHSADLQKSETWVPGQREIGNWPTNTWGAVYPRSGFIAQAEDPKAGAVIAQRAVDIVTREGQGFHYTALAHQGYRWETWGNPEAKSAHDCTEFGGRWIPPHPLNSRPGQCVSQRSVQWLPVSSEKTDKWQMISPAVDNRCETFGSTGEWSAGKEAKDGNYLFNYWRKYKCCIPRSGKYLRSVEF